MIPAIAVALLLAMACVALSVDSFWLGSARVETATGAEAAALAAGRELISDDLLRELADPEDRLERARQAAARVAAANVVAGSPLQLDTAPDGDIRFGELIFDPETGLTRFLETSENPTSVVVLAQRSRGRNNPVAMMVSGKPANVASQVEVSLSNHMVGVRPGKGVNVPAIPLAILDADADGADCWQVQIEAHQGEDNYGFNPDGDEVFSGADGLPEIVLRSQPIGGRRGDTTDTPSEKSEDVNMRLLDFGSGYDTGELDRQFESGWSVGDLSRYGGELMFQKDVIPVDAKSTLEQSEADLFEARIGQQRMCLLYTPPLTGTRVTVTRLVAIRIMNVEYAADGGFEIHVQPTVMSSAAVVLVNELAEQQLQDREKAADLAGNISAGQMPAESNSDDAFESGRRPKPMVVVPNPYIYKVQVTH